MRRYDCETSGLPSAVSIHASVKDATEIEGIVFVAIDVSIHASVKDATLWDIRAYSMTGFQSTHL